MSSLRSRTKAKAESRAAPLRTWSVTLIRNRGVFLGWVEAESAEAAEAQAAYKFDLDEFQRSRLIVRDQP